MSGPHETLFDSVHEYGKLSHKLLITPREVRPLIGEAKIEHDIHEPIIGQSGLFSDDTFYTLSVPESSPASSITVVIAAIAILPPLIGNLLTWAKDLSESATRQRKLDEAIKHITFWNSWQESMGESLTTEEKQASIVRLRRISTFITKMEDEHPELGHIAMKPNLLQRILVLQPLPRLARTLRLTFWLYLASAPFAGSALRFALGPFEQSFRGGVISRHHIILSVICGSFCLYTAIFTRSMAIRYASLSADDNPPRSARDHLKLFAGISKTG